MSYDLMVFDPAAAPQDRDGFMAWFKQQTKWNEDHDYNDPSVAPPELRDWFSEIIGTFPPLNGPYAGKDYDNPNLTDYSVGRSMVYAAFGWPQMETAYEVVLETARTHRIGFFDVSADDGQVWLPMTNGSYGVVHGTGCSIEKLGEVRVISMTGFKLLPPEDG